MRTRWQILLDKMRDTQSSFDRMRPWHVVFLSFTAAALFAYFGPRRGDDVGKAAQLAVLSSLRMQAIEACNHTAKENGDRIIFAQEKATFDLQLDKQDNLPAVEVRQSDYACFAPQGSDAQVYRNVD